MNRWIFASFCFAAIVAPASAQDWQPVTEALIAAEKPGFGKLCGVVVDHATGDLTINLSDRGLYRSTDQGKSWQKLGTPFKGRTETPGCLMLDPTGGKRLVAALVYGAPILVSPDRGETWEALDKKSTHVDWCAVDWSDAKLNFIFTLKHESGDLLLVSRDGGKSFDEVGKGYGPAWIFDGKTAVIAQAKSKKFPPNLKPGSLLRTTDAGKTFEPCGEYNARALPRWHKDTLYWVVEGALISTNDKGKSWKHLSFLKDGRFGPIFGKSADHLFVLTGAGIVESSDGGKSWGKAIAAPKEMKGLGGLAWLEYDPVHDTVYIMKMGTDLYRWQRK
jgi:BNR/Asp-box repeat